MNEAFKRALKESSRASGLTVEQMRVERADQGALKRNAKIAYHRTAGRLLVKTLGNRIGGSEVIGAGCDQLVFIDKDHDEVHKLLINSLGSTAAGAEQEARHHQEIFDRANLYLHGFMLETEYRTVNLSRAIGRHAVVAAQPAIRPIKSFPNNPSAIWTYDNNKDYRAHQLALAYRINDLYRATGMFPDLFGFGNAVVIDNSGDKNIRIVDTMVETPELLARPMWNDPTKTREERYQEILAEWLSYEAPKEQNESFEEALHQL
jgi:hypothetical protein